MGKETTATNTAAEIAWMATKPLLTETVISQREIIARFTKSTPTAPLTLFVPWGVRPAGQAGASETQALDTIQEYQQTLGESGVLAKVLLMPADVYAIEINGYPWESTTNYFNWVWTQAENREFQVLPWSAIRSQNQEQYDEILQWEANPESLWRNIPKSLWYRDLLPVAFRRSQMLGDQEIRTAAFNYLKERIAEARIIESVYQPIKLSMVSPAKDNIVDCELPRLYILPRDLRFPWLI